MVPVPPTSPATPSTFTSNVELRAAVAELAAILYGDGPTDAPLDSFGPIYAAAVEQLRAAFDDAVQDLLRGFPGVLPQDAARRTWEGLRHMTGAVTNFRALDLLLDQAAHTRPEPLPQSLDELLGAIARQPDIRSLKALLLRVLDAPPPLSRADRLRLHEVLTGPCGLDVVWVNEWRAGLPLSTNTTPTSNASPSPRGHQLAVANQPMPPPPIPLAWPFLNDKAITTLARPTWLIKDILPAAEVTVVAGPGDAGKTFLMVDIANRVAQHYPVLYVAAEDGAGIKVRKRAWELHHRAHHTGNFYMLNQALPLADSHMIDSFIAAAQGLGPKLIVVDTLSQCIAGVDENSSSGMSLVLDNAQRIARATGAAVVLIHHYTKDGATYRGSSVLKNNTYGFLEVERDSDDLIRLECNRIKNAPQFAPRYFRLVTVATDIPDDDDEPLISCVIKPATKVKRSADDLSKVEVRMLETLQVMTEADNGALTTILQQELGLKGRSFYGPLAHLRKYGLIAKDGDKRTAPLVITEAGREQLARHSAHPDLQAATPQNDAPTFVVNQRLGLLPQLPGSNCGSNVDVSSNLVATYRDEPITSASDTTLIPVTTTNQAQQQAENDVATTCYHVATTASDSNGHTSPVTTFHSRFLNSGREGSNGGETREETREQNETPATPNKPGWLKLSVDAWKRACDAWANGNTAVVNAIAQQHCVAYSDLVRALKRAARRG